MARWAGQMQPGDAPSGNWVLADGMVRHRHFWPDYIRNVGFDRPAGIDLVTLPIAPGWLVLLADEPDSPALPPDTPFATDPPSGPPPPPPPVITIQPIADATTAAHDDPTAPVTVTAASTPALALQARLFIGADPSGNWTTGSNGTWNFDVPVGSATVRVRDLPDMRAEVASNSFTVTAAAPPEPEPDPEPDPEPEDDPEQA